MFTEPFYSTTYSMAQSTLTYVDPEGVTKVEKNVSFQIKGAGEFDLVSKTGQVLQSLTLTHKGSDGMSERVFPYEVKDSGFVRMANSGIGGCTSNHLPAVNQ